MLKDWTTDELKEITRQLKQLPAEDRPEIRDKIKMLSAEDALEVLAIALCDQSGSPNKPRNAVKRKNAPLTADNSEIRQGSGNNDTLERVQGETLTDNIDIESLQVRISDIVNNYCLSNGMDSANDLLKAPQRVFGAVCSAIGENIKDIMRDHTPIYNGSAVLTNNNSVNIDALAQVLPLYFKLCDKYNKAVLIDHAANFCGVSRSYLYNIKDKLTSLGVDLLQKREDSLTAGIVDTKAAQVTGSIALLNHAYNWQTHATNRTEIRETAIIYPMLSQAGNKTPVIGNAETSQALSIGHF